jgi:hypothetical protein
VRRFLPWYLAVVLASLAASECGSLQIAARNAASLQRERDDLASAVTRVSMELTMLQLQQQCAADTRACQVE